MLVTTAPTSRSSTPGSEGTVRPRPILNNSSPYRNKGFAESSGSSQTLAAPQREQPRSDTGEQLSSLCVYPSFTYPGTTVPTVAPNDRVACIEKPAVGDLVASSLLLVSDAAAIGKAQVKDDPARQLRKTASMLLLHNSKSRPSEKDTAPEPDDNHKPKPHGLRSRMKGRWEAFLHS